MRIEFLEKENNSADTALLFKFQDEDLGAQGKVIDNASIGVISKTIQNNDQFSAKYAQTLVVTLSGEQSYKRAIIFGLGKSTDFDTGKFLEVGGKAFVILKANGAKKVDIFLSQNGLPSCCREHDVSMRFAEGLALRDYEFDRYKTKPAKKSHIEKIYVINKSAAENTKAFKGISARVESVHLARDYVSEPPNELHPVTYAKHIEEQLKPVDVKVTIFDEKKLTKMGAGAIMAVGQGAVPERQPRLVIMEYNGIGKSSKKPVLGLVGKGVTFDTGGFNIKSDGSMFGVYDMKFDMAGSAAIVGLMRTLARRKAKTHIVASVALAENSISDKAFLPSDVIKSLSGKTIEITNTDAEGRLVLCDALWYLQEKYGVETLMDMATLTGSIIIGVGLEYSGFYTDHDDIWAQVEQAGKTSQEKVWRMPMDEIWNKDLDSDIADMKNKATTGASAPSSKAALFLKRFIKKGVKWAHFDVAGPVWSKSPTALSPKGATGYGVRLLDELIAQNYESK